VWGIARPIKLDSQQQLSMLRILYGTCAAALMRFVRPTTLWTLSSSLTSRKWSSGRVSRPKAWQNASPVPAQAPPLNPSKPSFGVSG
jgi:hypothetical protein